MLTWRAHANYAEWLFSLRKRLRRDTVAIFCYSTDYADYAVDLAYTTLYMKHTHYADYADKINLHVTTRDYARLRPAGPRLREHSCSFMAIIAPSCRKKNAAHMPLLAASEAGCALKDLASLCPPSTLSNISRTRCTQLLRTCRQYYNLKPQPIIELGYPCIYSPVTRIPLLINSK